MLSDGKRKNVSATDLSQEKKYIFFSIQIWSIPQNGNSNPRWDSFYNIRFRFPGQNPDLFRPPILMEARLLSFRTLYKGNSFLSLGFLGLEKWNLSLSI